MSRLLRDRSQKVGKPPGQLIHIGDYSTTDVEITLVEFDQERVSVNEVDSVDVCLASAKKKDIVTWIDIRGLSDLKVIEDIGQMFGIHRLWLEDVLNTDHRPKIDVIQDTLFIILKAIDHVNTYPRIQAEQISLFLGETYVISFQEKNVDVLSVVKDRLQQSRGRIRHERAAYLFYSLIDAIVDDYYRVVNDLGNVIENMELQFEDQGEDLSNQIRKLRVELLLLNKIVTPARDFLATIVKGDHPLIHTKIKIYFQDVYEHANQINDALSQYRQLLTDLHDAHLGLINQRMNETMRFLTMFASIFIPLTFIVGVYGMNFENMPELKWEYGYFIIMGFMLAITLGMIIFYRRRKWI